MLGARKQDRKRNRRDTEHFRSHGARPGPDGLVSKDSRGEIVEGDPNLAGNWIGVITVDCTGCSGAAPTFTPGYGTAIRYRPSGTTFIATTTTFRCYNSLPGTIPAQDKLVQFMYADGRRWVAVADCDA